ncbi:MAG: 16S rRNA (guanine(527)-N(7))-methyltransferase RsmG [Dehalococcoidia bacterium]|nr:16S rRNA (guanine(527)-N(7))-methyltransferase RsmG [Dehalococcoidia bacterium]
MEQLIEGAGNLGIKLSARHIEQFKLYYRELIDWNSRVNLTAITDYSEVQVKHFLDSLTVTQVLSRQDLRSPDFRIMDVGTGAGFPGVPLKILYPEPELVLLEPTAKKTAFLQHISDRLKLQNVEVLNSTAEEAGHLPPYRERFNLVLSRAVATLPALAELTLPFCSIGGRLVAQKKGEIEEELGRAERAILTLGGRLSRVKRIDLTEFSDVRHLVIIDKIDATPDKYPRRPGIPKKRPL